MKNILPGLTVAALLAFPMEVLIAVEDKEVLAAAAKQEAAVDKIIAIISTRLHAQKGNEKISVKAESNLIKDLKMDSLDIAELMMDTEDVFKIKVPDKILDGHKDMTVKEYSEKISAIIKK